MKRLLNTIYITNEQSYLMLDGENIVCKLNENEKFRIPFDNVENIVCFNYTGCSPAFMGKCVEKGIRLSFISPQGKFLANVSGTTHGNVALRVKQIDIFRENKLKLAQNTVATKLANTIFLIKRSMHDNEKLRENDQLLRVIQSLKDGIDSVYASSDTEGVLGIEGNCAHQYFSIFDQLITVDTDIKFVNRSQYPPLDAVNAMLSFVYTIYTNEFAAALETVGLDSYIGYYHALRSGRVSLACDLVEEVRGIAERFVLTLLNLKVIDSRDFDTQISGAVWLNDNGRKKLLTKWQEKKRTDIVHPYLKQKIQFGLLPHIQSCLLAKYIRGDIDEYPNYISR